eukprot:gene545-440_t
MSGKPAANRTTLAQFKTRMVGAKKGHQLLKKKVDALTVKFRAMLKDIVMVKRDVAEQCMEAYFSTARANYSAGNIAAKATGQADKANCQRYCRESGEALGASTSQGARMPARAQMHPGATASRSDGWLACARNFK